MIIDAFAGILISLGVANIFDVPLTWWWVVLGIVFALVPDLDFFIELAQRKTVGGKKLGSHRVLTHTPLLFILPFILLYVFVNTSVAVLFLLGILWHFLHDSHAMGYGYRLLWPFSNKFYKFFCDKDGHYRYDRKHILVSWTKSEVEALHERHGNDEWIQDHLRYHATNWQKTVILLLKMSFALLLLLLIAQFVLFL